MGYRDAAEALRDRVDDLETRLARIDEESEASLRGLAPCVTERLRTLRASADLASQGAIGVAELTAAERAVDAYERGLDEALGLQAQLGKSLGGIFPGPRTVGRWASFATAALLGSTLAVYELGLSDFMLRAFGAKITIAHSQLTAGLLLDDFEVSPQREPTDDAFYQLIVESRPPAASEALSPEEGTPAGGPSEARSSERPPAEPSGR